MNSKVILITIFGLAAVGGAIFVYVRGSSSDEGEAPTGAAENSNSESVLSNPANTNQADANVGSVTWRDRGNGYEPTGTPPSCPDPLALATPVDLSKVYSILYPGQVRGNGFRAHGGFRFDGYAGDAITVTAPLDAAIIEAARYLENGHEQIFLTYLHLCGIMYRFDHLVTVPPQIQAFIDTLPPAVPDDSRSTPVQPPIPVNAGDTIATAVGSGDNVFIDFGVYDLRQENAASADPAWKAAHPTEYEQHGICWFDLLPAADAATVRAARAGGSDAGAESDYCVSP